MPLRGDKIQLETTRAEYLSITRIEVYTATLSGGSMTKKITKNIGFDKYNDICVNSAGKDIDKGQTLIKGDIKLNDCLARCARK
jgi:hypothetical protein